MLQETKTLLEFRGVSKAYQTRGGNVLAVDDLNLKVRDGEFLTIVGPSGCGKSTLLNMLAGLEEPSTGQILLNGRPASEAQREIGYVMQNDNLYPWRTLLDNVTFPLEIRGMPVAERKVIARDYLKKVHLDGFEDKYPYELSGGMRQRGNIVRALTFSPSLLIMDEPFGPLDAQTRLLLQMQLMELWREEKKTVIFITHDLPEAIALGDRVMVMSARPGRAKSILPVEIPRPRNIAHIHENEGYRNLLSRLGDELAEEIQIAAELKQTA
jgi:NitT/TauT family transport system ATP-binding protein